MQPDLSIPVIWTVRDGVLAGRLDVYPDRLHLDGGGRHSRQQRDLPYSAIAAARITRESGDRIHGRAAMLLELTDGTSVSLASFDRPGTLSELLHRIEDRLA